MHAQPPPKQKKPFQYSSLSRVQPIHAFVDVILLFCRWEWWDIALHLRTYVHTYVRNSFEPILGSCAIRSGSKQAGCTEASPLAPFIL